MNIRHIVFALVVAIAIAATVAGYALVSDSSALGDKVLAHARCDVLFAFS